MKPGRGEVIVTSGCMERRTPVAIHGKSNRVAQLSTTMAQVVITHKRMAWCIQLVVLDNLASLVVAKQLGNSLGVVKVAPGGVALAEFAHRRGRLFATNVVMWATSLPDVRLMW